MNNGSICKQHSGIEARINEMEEQTSRQWTALSKQQEAMEGMRKTAFGLVGGIIATLLGVVLNLIVLLMKT